MQENRLLFFRIADNFCKDKEHRLCEDLNRERLFLRLNKLKSLKLILKPARPNNAWLEEPAFFFSPMKESIPERLPSMWTVIRRPSGVSADGSESGALTRFAIYPDPAPHAGFFPLQRVQIQALACSPPSTRGLAITHWSTRELARQIIEDGILTEIHYSTVYAILEESELKPNRHHYWKTRIAPDFLEKASSVLWYYEQAPQLAKQGIVVICLDEKPSIQALERRFPTLSIKPGHIERREYEYIRHGVTHFMAGFRLHDGWAWGRSFTKKSQVFFADCLDRLTHKHRDAKKIHFIADNDSTHSRGAVADFIKSKKGKVAIHYTPVHASWLNQAEILLSIITRKYLHRGSWSHLKELKRTLRQSVSERNRFDKHPFDWSFTRHAMRDWYARYSCVT